MKTTILSLVFFFFSQLAFSGDGSSGGGPKMSAYIKLIADDISDFRLKNEDILNVEGIQARLDEKYIKIQDNFIIISVKKSPIKDVQLNTGEIIYIQPSLDLE
jgi:hypothetical protein